MSVIIIIYHIPTIEFALVPVAITCITCTGKYCPTGKLLNDNISPLGTLTVTFLNWLEVASAPVFMVDVSPTYIKQPGLLAVVAEPPFNPK